MDFLTFPDFAHQDKRGHVIAGATIGLASALVVEWVDREADLGLKPWQKRVIAFIPVVAAAIAKEAYDAFHPDRHCCEPADAYATVLGGAISIEIIALRW